MSVVTSSPFGCAPRWQELVKQLGLIRHPERGYFAETYRSSLLLTDLPDRPARAASTAIYFLLAAESAEPATTYLHRLRSDEVFHLYEGGPLDVLLLLPDGQVNLHRLGLNLNAGERPQLVIPAGTWFGTELVAGVSHCLWGCTVAPGFDFSDFELAQGPELAVRYPGARDRIARMSRLGSEG